MHLSCLRRWQTTLLSQRLTSERLLQAAQCQVCRKPLKIDGAPLLPSVAHCALQVRPGTLLVATEKLEGTGRTFHRSVILICRTAADTDTQFGGRVKGVDISRVIADTTLLRAAAGSGLSLELRSGGPVCGGRLGVVHFIALTTLVAFQGHSSAIFEAPQEGESAPVALLGPDRCEGYSHTHAVELVQRAVTHAEAASTANVALHAGTLVLCRGHAAWAPGQLESEIQMGNWATCQGTHRDVLETPASELWEHLWASGRLVRARQ